MTTLRCPQCGHELGDEDAIQGWRTRPPYGYTLENGNLVILEYEAVVVKQIFKMRYLEEPTPAYHEIAYRLREAGIPTKTRSGTWAGDSIRRICLNPVYQGKIVLNGMVYNGTHDAIVPPWKESDTDYRKVLKEFFHEER